MNILLTTLVSINENYPSKLVDELSKKYTEYLPKFLVQAQGEVIPGVMLLRISIC